MLQLCTVYAQSTTDTAALYCCSSVLSMCSPTQILQLCLCAAHHSYCSSVLSMPQILQPCTVYAPATDTAALYCLCHRYCSSVLSMHHRYCSSVLSMPQILQLCTVYVQPTTYTATLYCLYHRYCSSVLSLPQTLQLCTVADLYYVQPTTETAALYCLCADSPSGQCLPGGRVGRKSCAVCDRTTNQQSTQSRTYKHTSVCVYLIVLSMNE